jgi:hypothetical protein
MLHLNQISCAITLYHYKINEVICTSPKLFSEFLFLEHERRAQIKWQQLIFRSVIPAANLAVEAQQPFTETQMQKLAA